MSRRIATAHLEVTVADQSLQDHQTRLAAVQQAWSNLGTGAQNFANAFTGVSATGLQQFTAAIRGLASIDATKLAAVRNAFTPLLSVNTAALTTDIRNLTTSFAAMNTMAAPLAQNLKSIADSLLRMGNRAQTIASQQQQAANAAQGLAAQVAQTNAALAAQAASTLQLSQQYAGLLSGLQKYTKAQQQANVVKRQAAKDSDFLERAYIRHSTSIFIAGQQIKYATEQFRDAAQEIDLTRVLAKALVTEADIGGSTQRWARIFEDTRRATSGMVSDLQILKSAALMSSFNIPMQSFAKNMQVIQKLSIRTGQDMQYMMDSFARGVSRLSPAILDNLGLQIKLSDAYQVYAAALGTSSDNLTTTQKKQAVLNEVIRQGSELTKDIDPYASYQASLDRTIASTENFFNYLKGKVLTFIGTLAQSQGEATGSAADLLKIRIAELAKYGRVVTEDAKNASIAISADFQDEMNLLKESAEGFGTILGMAGLSQVMVARTSYDLSKMTLEQQRKLSEGLAQEAKDYEKLGEVIDRLSAIRSKQEFRSPEILKNLEDTKAIFTGLFKEVDTLTASTSSKADLMSGSLKSIFKATADEQLTQIKNVLESAAAAANAMADEGFFKTSEIAQMTQSLVGPMLVTFAERVKNLAQERLEASLRDQASQEAQLRTAERLNIQSQMLTDSTKLRLMDSYEIQKVEQELADAQKVYEERLKKRMEDSASMRAEDVQQAAQQVKDLSIIVAKAQERKRIDEEANKILKDQSFWTQSMKNAEAARLSNGKSREEIQARMLVLQKLLNTEIATQRDLELESAGAVRSRLEAMTSIFGFSFLTGEKDRKQRIADMKDEIVKLNEALKLLKTPSGGGGGRKEKEPKAPELDEVISKATDIASTFNKVRNELSLTASELTTVKFFQDGQEIKDAASTYTEAIDSLVLGIDRREGKGLFGIFGGEDIPGMIEENSKALEELMKFHRETGIMTDEMRVYRDTLLETNEGLREHLRLWTEVTKAINDFGSATTWAFEGAKGLFSDQFLSTIDSFVTKIGDLAGTIEKGLNGQANAYDLLGSSLGIARVFTNEYIKNLRARAAVEAMFNAGMAFAAWGNPSKMAAHIAAALAFSAVAGGAVRLPGQSSGRDAQAQGGQAGPLHIHLYSEMAMTDAERGYLIDRAVAQAAAEGRV
jgi:hypothetical protein